ncbi:MAG: signal recognition particle-docking protein FtsY [Spirochaetaceae bacterium]|nr:MAG: signal recognition particle-docking protein FtsY [Spirochaetaceae bacterium]
MKKGLGAKLKALFTGSTDTDEFFEALEDSLIEADLGAAVAMEISDAVRSGARKARLNTEDELRAALSDLIAQRVKSIDLRPDANRLNVFLVLGVNGVGKTTTIAKLAHYARTVWNQSGVVLAAGDTFRAAAVDQLSIHAERLGVRIVRQGTGADPGAVIYDAVQSAVTRGERLVLADTAGRMHNKANLVAELQKIDRIVAGRSSDCNYRKLLVIDATTGQNGLRQAEIFHDAVGVDAAILAKYDSTARGGIVVPISAMGIPFAFIGSGERYEDIHPFDSGRYAAELVSQ